MRDVVPSPPQRRHCEAERFSRLAMGRSFACLSAVARKTPPIWEFRDTGGRETRGVVCLAQSLPSGRNATFAAFPYPPPAENVRRSWHQLRSLTQLACFSLQSALSIERRALLATCDVRQFGKGGSRIQGASARRQKRRGRASLRSAGAFGVAKQQPEQLLQ